MNKLKKIVLVGHFGVGKSSLIRRFVKNEFSDDYMVTIGVHILKKEVTVEKENYTLVLWDIEGKESIKDVREAYLLGTSGFIYVFDVTRDSTFIKIEEDIAHINQKYKFPSLVIAANKCDLIDEKIAKIKLENYQIKPDFFTSAKTGHQVDELFIKLTKKMIENED